jgi:hypothetical protein
MLEADVLFNPARRFGTDGSPGVRDVQDLATHELGHALGLHHSPVAAATMYPDGGEGQTLARTLDADDRAGVRALYDTAPDPALGEIAGRVLTTSESPVFGAHVVAVDVAGVIRLGALTAMDGQFSLPRLPPGGYEVYAEPLDGPVTADHLPAYFRTVQRRFRTTFAGGNQAPNTIRVAAGGTTQIDPIRVDARAGMLNPQFLGWSEDGTSFRDSASLPLQFTAGRHTYLALVGPGLAAVPDSGFRVGGSDVTVDTQARSRGETTLGFPYTILFVSVRAGAAPGARSLFAVTATEQAAFTGCLDIVAP